MSAFTNRQMRRHPEMFGLTLYAPDGDEGAGGGGAGTALLEKPAAVAGETEGEQAGASEEDEGEEGADEAAAAAAALAAAKPAVQHDPETQALLDAAVEHGKELGRTEVKTVAQTEAEQATKLQRQTELKNLRTTRDEKIAAVRLVSKDADGEEVTLKLPAAIETQLTKILTDHDADLEEHFGLGFRHTQEANMLALLPEAKQPDAQKALDAATDYQAHAKAFGEQYAPHSDVIKNMGLEELVKLSTKANLDHKALLKAAKLESRLQGQDDVHAEPVIGGAAPGAAKTFAELAAGYGAGTLTDAEDASYLKLRAEREATGG